ncbi:cupin domain-containing protein [Actinomadura sp. HBU206391]|nr:cupin domain-containing protein [Actinomadura sp. HBU206391]
MSVVRTADSRRTETPNAVMTTFASPSLGGAGQSLWRVDMNPGAQGPLHLFDVEQIWSVVGGAATVEVDGETFGVGPGDTVVMPPAVPRRVTADPHAGFAAVVTAAGGARATLPDGTDKGVPPWIA